MKIGISYTHHSISSAFISIACLFVSSNNASNTSDGNNNFIDFKLSTKSDFEVQQDSAYLKFYHKIEQQIDLYKLNNGNVDLHIQKWHNYSQFIDLISLHFTDSLCLLSNYKIYLKTIDFEDTNIDYDWNPFEDPIVDNIVSKSKLVTSDEMNNLTLDSLWLLKSMSQLHIPDSIAFMDCQTSAIKIADNTHFKFVRYNCAHSYLTKTNLPEIRTYLSFTSKIQSIAQQHDVFISF